MKKKVLLMLLPLLASALSGCGGDKSTSNSNSGDNTKYPILASNDNVNSKN